MDLSARSMHLMLMVTYAWENGNHVASHTAPTGEGTSTVT